jgi:hypothetical protein
VWIEGQLVPVTEALAIVKRRSKPPETEPESEEDPLTPTTAPQPVEQPTVAEVQSTLKWLIYGKPGQMSPLAYVLYGLLTLGGGSIAGFTVTEEKHADLPTQEELATAVAECATEESVKALTEKVVALTSEVAQMDAAIESHKTSEAHPGAIKRMSAIETEVAVLNRTIEILHK